jgi:AraC-like DNA-binding protein
MTPYVQKELFREGILKPGPFVESYDLKCFVPSKDMQPFVEHYFISRRRIAYDPQYVGNDVLSQPVVTFFINPEGAYFEGPTTQKRTLVAKDSPIYVGAQFRPGGFYPLWQKSVSELAEKNIPAAEVVGRPVDPGAILARSDQEILTEIEALLRIRKFRLDPMITLVNTIIAVIEKSHGDITVMAIAERFGMSERSLQHLFRTYVGVGVKWAIMRARFLEVIKRARQEEKIDWTLISAEFGYTDQSHFIKDFRRLIGQAPAQYMRELSSQ